MLSIHDGRRGLFFTSVSNRHPVRNGAERGVSYFLIAVAVKSVDDLEGCPLTGEIVTCTNQVMSNVQLVVCSL